MKTLALSTAVISPTAQDWCIDDVVSQLRMLRKESLAAAAALGSQLYCRHEQP